MKNIELLDDYLFEFEERESVTYIIKGHIFVVDRFGFCETCKICNVTWNEHTSNENKISCTEQQIKNLLE